MGDTYYDEAARTAAVAKAERWTDRQACRLNTTVVFNRHTASPESHTAAHADLRAKTVRMRAWGSITDP